MTIMEEISYEEFAKLDMRTARIEAAERIEGATKLLRLTVDIGSEKRQVVAGIAEWYAPESLVGRTIVVLANLKPRAIRGVESKGMLLAADVEGKAMLLTTDQAVPVGAQVR